MLFQSKDKERRVECFQESYLIVLNFILIAPSSPGGGVKVGLKS